MQQRLRFLDVALAGLLAAALASACAKKDDGGKPSPVPAMNPGAASAPADPAAPPAPAAAAPVGAGTAGEAARPADHPADPGATITGRIVLPPAQAKTKPKGTLFLVARRPSDNPTVRGTLIAVKKLPATAFPLPFSLGAADMPFQNGPFDGEMTLSVRIDQDGDPMSRQKGDLYGLLPKVRVGSRDVVLSLDQVQAETESLGQPSGPMAPMGAPGGKLPAGHP